MRFAMPMTFWPLSFIVPYFFRVWLDSWQGPLFVGCLVRRWLSRLSEPVDFWNMCVEQVDMVFAYLTTQHRPCVTKPDAIATAVGFPFMKINLVRDLGLSLTAVFNWIRLLSLLGPMMITCKFVFSSDDIPQWLSIFGNRVKSRQSVGSDLFGHFSVAGETVSLMTDTKDFWLLIQSKSI